MSADAIDRATTAVDAAAARASACPKRPRFHFLPPSGWMNDPNGTTWHDGRYHLFYQHNPFRPRWGRIHWGHARSRDLVHWEHLPIALAPRGGLGERHCFSGCCAIADDGTPTILYTRVGLASLLSRARRWADQCAALGDVDLVRWRRYPHNPVLDASVHGGAGIRDWRDPYVFAHDGHRYLVLAGTESGEPAGSVLLYRASGLLDWEYRGRLSLGDPSLHKGVECPNYVEVDGRWVLLVSPYGPVRYRVGDFGDERHAGGEWRTFDHGRAFYATNTFVDGGGRTVVVGWIRGMRGDGWAGSLSLPREIHVRADGTLAIEPVPELESLRRDHIAIEIPPGSSDDSVAGVPFPDRAVELKTRYHLDRAGTCGFEVRSGAVRHRVTIDRPRGTITCGSETATLSSTDSADHLDVRAFLDASILEVFVDGRDAFTSLVPFDGSRAAAVEIVPLASGGAEAVHVDLWRMARA